MREYKTQYVQSGGGKPAGVRNVDCLASLIFPFLCKDFGLPKLQKETEAVYFNLPEQRMLQGLLCYPHSSPDFPQKGSIQPSIWNRKIIIWYTSNELCSKCTSLCMKKKIWHEEKNSTVLPPVKLHCKRSSDKEEVFRRMHRNWFFSLCNDVC